MLNKKKIASENSFGLHIDKKQNQCIKKIKNKNGNISVDNSQHIHYHTRFSKVLNHELEHKFYLIWKQYHDKNFVSSERFLFDRWHSNNWHYTAEDFDDAKYIYLDDEVGVDDPDIDSNNNENHITENDVRFLIKEKLVEKFSEKWNPSNSIGVYRGSHFMYYLILTNKGIMYFEKDEEIK